MSKISSSDGDVDCNIKPKIVFTAEQVSEAVQFLQAGGVLAYPSESVWGLGCDAFNEQALQRIFALKERDLGKGLIVLTDRATRLKDLIVDEIDGEQAIERIQQIDAQDMLNAGRATSWVVPVRQNVLPSLLTGDFADLAVRITPHPVLSSLCQGSISQSNPFGLLVSTSCNTAGKTPAGNLTQAYRYFGDAVGYLDCESLGFVQPSQIIELATGKILR